MKKFIVSLVGVLVVCAASWWSMAQKPDLVVYCAHDSVYADAVIQKFEKQTGLDVVVRYDTEATKSLGLTELLKKESLRPQCDVFWNNELLGTLDLAADGVLAPYRGDGYTRMPENAKDPDCFWVGFGARMRVYIVNTNRIEASYDAIERRLASDDLSGTAIARPLYGTTLTHYCVLWREMGEDALKAWHRDVRRRGMKELTGNSTVKNQVAAGGLDFGFTDTDDFFLAKDAGAPVALLPVRLADGSTIVIPNTAALIRGAPHPENAKRFVDYLLSAETELLLANSASRQVPLGPVDESRLSEEVRALRPAAARGRSLNGLGDIRANCVAWLKSEGRR